MSAIGSYAVLRRNALPKCLALAREIHTATTSKGMFNAIRAAEAVYRRELAEVSPERVVVFIIR